MTLEQAKQDTIKLQQKAIQSLHAEIKDLDKQNALLKAMVYCLVNQTPDSTAVLLSEDLTNALNDNLHQKLSKKIDTNISDEVIIRLSVPQEVVNRGKRWGSKLPVV